MNNPFGYPAKQWTKAKREARDVLVEAARDETVVSYSDLVAEIEAITFDAHDIRLNTLLGQISEDENTAGRGMLSVVVVHKEGDQHPGAGFFEWAEELGYTVNDRDKFWIRMLHDVYSCWRNNRTAP
jgi:hypothetical protein